MCSVTDGYIITDEFISMYCVMKTYVICMNSEIKRIRMMMVWKYNKVQHSVLESD